MEDKPKVLIIDDEDVMCDSITLTLGNSGYGLWVAKDGESGINKASEIRPDLVLLDLKMPGIGGIEVLKKLLGMDIEMVVVIITGYGTVDSAVEAMKLGAYDFITKPFTPDQLRIVVNRGLEKRKLVLKTLSLQQEKEKLRDNFIRITSHELKSPLAAAQQNVDVILAGMVGNAPEKMKDLMQRVDVRLKEMLKLINNWVNITRFNTGKLVDKKEKIYLANILEDVVSIFKKTAQIKKVDIKLDIPKSINAVCGDAEKLKEVFTNLLDNAIKYNKDNGSVLVKAERNKDNLIIKFVDTGIGISEKHLPFIFDEFFRVSKKSAPDSAGLGLFISKKIIEAHNGSINVKSEINKGTTFTVVLPSLKK